MGVTTPEGADSVTGELDSETVTTPPKKPSAAVELAFTGTSQVLTSEPCVGTARSTLEVVGSEI